MLIIYLWSLLYKIQLPTQSSLMLSTMKNLNPWPWAPSSSQLVFSIMLLNSSTCVPSSFSQVCPAPLPTASITLDFFLLLSPFLLWTTKGSPITSRPSLGLLTRRVSKKNFPCQNPFKQRDFSSKISFRYSLRQEAELGVDVTVDTFCYL